MRKIMFGVLEEVPLWMCRVDTPPVVGKYVENAEDNYEERRGPFRLEADSNHNAGRETKYGHKDTGNAPVPLENETDEKENEENTTSKQEASVDSL